MAAISLAATAMAQTGDTQTQRQGAAQGATDARSGHGADASPHRQHSPADQAGSPTNRQQTSGGANAQSNRATDTDATRAGATGTDATRTDATSERMDGTRTGTQGQAMVGQGRSDKVVRARDLINSPVHNEQGERIGAVQEIYLDENTGRIHFAAVDAGNWAEMDDGIILVSWQKLEKDDTRRDGADANRAQADTAATTTAAGQTMTGDRRDRGAQDHAFKVSMDREAIRQAPNVDNLDNVDQNWLRGAAKKANVDGVDNVKLVRGSEIRDQDLFDQQMNKIGKIEAVMIDPQDGSATIAVLRVDEAPQNDRNLTAVPFDQIREREDDTPGYVIQMDRARLNAMQYFEANNWPDFADPTWSREVTLYQPTDR